MRGPLSLTLRSQHLTLIFSMGKSGRKDTLLLSISPHRVHVSLHAKHSLTHILCFLVYIYFENMYPGFLIFLSCVCMCRME